MPPTSPPTPSNDPEGSARFRRTLVKVMTMQGVALLALWWLQFRYAR